MAIAITRHFEELPSRLHLLSSQTLSLMSSAHENPIQEFDLMNLNGLYRFLEDFKVNELVDHATTGVLGIDPDETFDEGLAGQEAVLASKSIETSLREAYPGVDPIEGAKKLQFVLVKLAGLKPKQPVSQIDTEAAESALKAIVSKLKKKSQPQLLHA